MNRIRSVAARALAFWLLGAVVPPAVHSVSDADVSALLTGQLEIDGLVKQDNAQDAFRVGAAHLQRVPDDVVVLTELAIFGVERVKRGDASFASQAEDYGARALEMMEKDRMPAHFEAAAWQDYKKQWLAPLYQSLGIEANLLKRTDEARARLTKAAALDPKDPLNQIMLGGIANEEYLEAIKRYKTEGPGPAHDMTLARANAKLDEVIERYARGVALAEGRPELQQLRDQVMPNLEKYYQYRHKSSAGLRELIAKYRTQS